MAPLEGSYRHAGHRITYDVWGEGERTLVLVHGLLMNRHMYDRLAPELAARGNRVICLDLLGHGRSDRPDDMRLYNMPGFAKQLLAALDHLELEAPVLGGTSLGANVGLEFASAYPDRARGLFIEMPVLDNALLGAVMTFTPVLLALRFGRPVLKALGAVARRIPRTNHNVDVALDWIRQEPEPSRAVLEGILLGRSAPPHDDRVKLEHPALVIGHPNDPLHPFSDADMLVEEMPNARLIDANSIFEWRMRPERLDNELSDFLDDVYSAPAVATGALDAA
jgi:pimeloyl-ACP methyl ester carboxylesterase